MPSRSWYSLHTENPHFTSDDSAHSRLPETVGLPAVGTMELFARNHISSGHTSPSTSRSPTITHSSTKGKPILKLRTCACNHLHRRQVISLVLGALECCVTDDKYAMAPFSLRLSLQPRNVTVSLGSCRCFAKYVINWRTVLAVSA